MQIPHAKYHNAMLIVPKVTLCIMYLKIMGIRAG